MPSQAYIIIPVHNRKSITLKCLETLQQNGDMAQYSVVVVDDGSTDGTSAAIKEQFPQVHILQGDGNLWWTGAICMGMKYAIAQGAEYIIWLNDDCLPQQGALNQLMTLCQENSQLIVGGNILDQEHYQTIYSGFRFYPYPPTSVNSWAPNQLLIECDALNGNMTCFHKSIVQKIDYPNYHIFPHYGGDIMYSFKAMKQGYMLRICASAIGLSTPNKNNSNALSILSTKQEMIKNLQQRFNVKSGTFWKAEFGMYWLVYGIKGIIYRIVSIVSVTVLVLLLPKILRKYINIPVMQIYHKLKYVF